MTSLKIVCHPIKNETGNYIIERAPADPHDCVSRSVSILISISDHLMFYDKATLVQLYNNLGLLNKNNDIYE